MKRTLNRKALLILVLSLAGAITGVHFLHAFQVRRNAGELLAEAGRAEGAGKPADAVRLLKDYLGLRPNQAEVQARYGLLLARTAPSRSVRLQAFLVLEKALRAGQDRPEVRRAIARLALFDLYRFADARVHLDVLLKDAPEDAELEGMMGASEAGSRRYTQAVEWFARAAAHKPELIHNYLSQAHLYRTRLNRPDDADRTIQEMVQNNPGSVEARLAAARYYLTFHLWDQADQEVSTALDRLKTQDALAFVLGAEVAQVQAARTADEEQGRKYLERRRALLEEGVRLHPEDPRLNVALAQLELQNARAPAPGSPALDPHAVRARELLRHAANTLPEAPEELLRLGDVLAGLGEPEPAGRIGQKLRAAGDGAAAEYLQARVLAQQAEWARARALLTARLSEMHLPELVKRAYLLLGQCADQLQNPDAALAAFRRALHDDPMWAPANLACASVLARRGQLDAAVECYRKCLVPVPETGLDLVRLLVLRNLTFPEAARNWDEAERVLANLPGDLRRSADAAVVRAGVLAARHNVEEARDVLERERARRPEEMGPWLALIRLHAREGRFETATRLAEETRKRFGDQEDVLSAQIFVSLNRDRDAALAGFAVVEKGLVALPAPARSRLATELGDAYQQMGDPTAAVRTWGGAAAQDPRDLNVRVRLLQAAIQGRDEAELQRLLEEIGQVEGEGGPLWSFGEAARLVLAARRPDRAVLDQARRHLDEAARQRPTWPAVAAVQAQLAEAAGDPDQALEHFQHAIDQGDRRPAVIRRTVDLLFERRRYDDAQKVLAKLPDRVPDAGPGLDRRAAELALLTMPQGDAVRGRHVLDQARRLVPEASKNYQDYLWLGQVASVAGELAEAESLFRRAVTLAPTRPESWVSLVTVLVPTDPKKARAAIEEAKPKLPPDAAPLALSSCYEAVGELQKAHDQLAAARAARPNDPAILYNSANFYARHGPLDQAHACLRKLMAPQTKAPPAARDWARRHLAVSLAASGTYSNFREALRLLGDASQGEPGIEDERARGQVLSSQPYHRGEAIEILERLERRSVLEPPEQFVLARLYDAEGDWDRAHLLLLKAIKADPTHRGYLLYYASKLLDRGQAAAARPWIDKLEAVDKTPSFPTSAVRARYLHKQGRTDDAVRRLQELVERFPDRLAATALLFEEFERFPDAERAYRALAARRQEPGHFLFLARYLARHDRFAEAVALFDKAWEDCPPEEVAQAALDAFPNKATAQQYLPNLESHLRAALARKPQSVQLRWALARVNESQGRYDDAIALYRNILDVEPANPAALNGLGWLLALKEGRGAEAVSLLDRAIETAGPVPDYLDTRGIAYLMDKKPAPALKDLGAAVRISAAPVYYFHLARTHYLVNDRRQAVAMMLKAEALGLSTARVDPLEQAAYRQLMVLR